MPPTSTVQTFTDPDNYAASLRLTTASEITISGRGLFTAKLVSINFHRLSMRRFFDNLPRSSHSVDNPGYANISFRTLPGPSLRRGGVEMLQTNIIRRGHAETYFQKSDGLACFGTISLSVADMAAVGAAVGGCDLTPLKDALTIVPSPGPMGRLLRLHAAAGTLAEDSPAVIVHPEAARGLEQALIEAMVDCLRVGEVGEDRSALRQHAKIMGRFHRAVEERPDQAIFIPELCTAVGASERTLRTCCQEQLGVSPKRYLMLRRMHLVRRGLRESAPTATTVTEVATRYGFWQFGRFAGEYRSLFGELPSTTLGRTGDAPPSDFCISAGNE
jgi:AraC-like DNA-binding protein